MAEYTNPLSGVLRRINNVAAVDIEDLNDDGEWIRLSSEQLPDRKLYDKLMNRWAGIAGYIHKFALVYCHTGDEAGVWLHYLDTQQLRSEYQVGCFSVPTWY